MELGELVRQLTDLIWEREQRSGRSMDAPILSYVQDATATQLEYRRRMHELDRRLAELERLEETHTPS